MIENLIQIMVVGLTSLDDIGANMVTIFSCIGMSIYGTSLYNRLVFRIDRLEEKLQMKDN